MVSPHGVKLNVADLVTISHCTECKREGMLIQHTMSLLLVVVETAVEILPTYCI